MTKQLQTLLCFCQSNGRACPQSMKWNELWEMIPDKERKGLGWDPLLPLILAAWWEASPEQKRDRLQQHLLYAEGKGVLDKIETFLRELSENEWFHEND